MLDFRKCHAIRLSCRGAQEESSNDQEEKFHSKAKLPSESSERVKRKKYSLIGISEIVEDVFVVEFH